MENDVAIPPAPASEPEAEQRNATKEPTSPATPSTPPEPPSAPAPEPTPPAPSLDAQARRERAITDALRTAVRDAFQQHYRASTDNLDELHLDLRLRVRPAENWDLAFDPPLFDQVLAQLADHEADFASYLEGHVYCFHCNSANCEHSLPPTALSVFDAYSSTGEPKWVELTQKLLDAQHPDVARLYESRAPVLNLLQFGKELKADQLASFGRASKTYAILGQVAVGYFKPPRPKHQRGRAKTNAAKPPTVNADRFAVTFQIVETRAPGGRLDLRLNTIVHPGTVPDILELLNSDWAPWLRRARQLTIENLATVQGMALGAREGNDPKRYQKHMGKTAGILRKFSRSLTRGNRQSKRRTQHAEHRRQEHTRPTDKAYGDATSATDDHIYWEERNTTIAVVAEGGRTHIFSAQGKHVTSFTLKKDGLERRLRAKRWRPATAEERDAFRSGFTA